MITCLPASLSGGELANESRLNPQKANSKWSGRSEIQMWDGGKKGLTRWSRALAKSPGGQEARAVLLDRVAIFMAPYSKGPQTHKL